MKKQMNLYRQIDINVIPDVLSKMGITPIEIDDRKIFSKYFVKKKNSYADSWYYITQAANCRKFNSSCLGFKYEAGSCLISIGYFLRPTDGQLCFHLINPLGENCLKHVNYLASAIWKNLKVPVYIKKLDSVIFKNLKKLRNFYAAEKYPWHSKAIFEDDTYPEIILDIEKTLSLLNSPGYNEVKDKYRRFLKRNSTNTLEWKVLDDSIKPDAYQIINKFFEYKSEIHVDISSPADYENMIEYQPLGEQGIYYISEIFYINNEPVSFLAMESINESKAMGLYSNLCLYQEHKYLSEYVIVYALNKVKSTSKIFLNLGGSESEGLDKFKSKFCPVQLSDDACWLIYIGE